jgi:hypothetical protein
MNSIAVPPVRSYLSRTGSPGFDRKFLGECRSRERPLDFITGSKIRREKVMCPACLTTVAIAVAGSASASGLGALAVKKLRARTGAPVGATVPKQGETR